MADLRELDIRHLIAFDAVVEAGTFGRAAERLGYTQSAVSQQIAALERLVGGALFDRPGGPRAPELTPLGRWVLEAARDLLARVDALSIDLDRFQTGQVGRVTVGSMQSVSTTLLPMIVGRMRRERPDIEVRVIEADTDDELAASLRRSECDLSFTVGEWGPDVQTRHLLDDPFVIVARPGQFPDGPLPLAAIADEPMVGQHHNSCQIFNEAGLRAAGLVPHYVFRSNDNGTVAAMVREGMGVAVMPMLCIDDDDQRLALHPIDPPMPDRAINIGWLRGRTLSPAAEHFVHVAAEVAEQSRAEAVVSPA